MFPRATHFFKTVQFVFLGKVQELLTIRVKYYQKKNSHFKKGLPIHHVMFFFPVLLYPSYSCGTHTHTHSKVW